MGLWDIGNDVGEDLFDAVVAVAEEGAIVETMKCFLGIVKGNVPVFLSVDQVIPDVLQDPIFMKHVVWRIYIGG